jgi:predicted nucleic acid-binding protein
MARHSRRHRGGAGSAQLSVADPHPLQDSLIAAGALVHGMTVATRNIADFAPIWVGLLNLWDA